MTSEFPDLVVNLCEADPDKKIEKALISSRRIGPNDGARLCLVARRSRTSDMRKQHV